MLKRSFYFLVLFLLSTPLMIAGKGGSKGGPNKGGGGGEPQAVTASFTTVYDGSGDPVGINPDDGGSYTDDSLNGDPGIATSIDSGTYSLTMSPDRVNFSECCYYERYFYFDVQLPSTCQRSLDGDGEAKVFLKLDTGDLAIGESNSTSAIGQVVGLVWDPNAPRSDGSSGGWDAQGILLNLSWSNSVTVTREGENLWHIATESGDLATIEEPAARGNKKVTCGTAAIPFDLTIAAP